MSAGHLESGPQTVPVTGAAGLGGWAAYIALLHVWTSGNRGWEPQGHRHLGCQAACEMWLSRVGGRDDDTCLPELRRLPFPG